MVNDVGILVICLCSLLVYPVPVGTYPNIWLFNTVWTQLPMDSSGRMEMMFHSQVLRFNQGTVLFRELSLKGVSFPTVDSMILLQNSRGLHWDSPVGACRKFRTAFFPPWRAPRTRGLLGCRALTAGLLAWQLVLLLTDPALVSTQSWKLFMLFDTRAGTHVKYAASRPWIGLPGIVR